MWQLNLPAYNFRIIKKNEKPFIFDDLRKKFVALTPEEWVRQHFIRFLINVKHYPASLIAIEKQLVINGLKKRCDAVVYSRNAEPLMIIEFKATTVSIAQQTFDQAAVYNSKLKVDYFIISNGLKHYCCRLDKNVLQYNFLDDIPDFDSL
ncbi:MAG: type I restriction enzyme HsdR N-terminal domain-containing protein [Paludibacter sp.]|jgi:type I site-specific restriction-modification system R (restriction) subunit|nr:type I restriction enzyme HsdR N-terminal domain-containing protein [Paludibacter sp.]